MRSLCKAAYWIAGLAASAAWSATILLFGSFPIPVDVVLCGMALVACLWGHTVLFPSPRLEERIAAPGRTPRGAARSEA